MAIDRNSAMRPEARTEMSATHIASRVLAIVVLAFPLGALGWASERQDQRALESFGTVEELRAYFASYLLGSYWACFAVAVLLGFAYVALVEGVAFALRLGLRALGLPHGQGAA